MDKGIDRIKFDCDFRLEKSMSIRILYRGILSFILSIACPYLCLKRLPKGCSGSCQAFLMYSTFGFNVFLHTVIVVFEHFPDFMLSYNAKTLLLPLALFWIADLKAKARPFCNSLRSIRRNHILFAKPMLEFPRAALCSFEIVMELFLSTMLPVRFAIDSLISAITILYPELGKGRP